MLLLELGRIVSVDHLIDVLWEHDPPNTARTQVQICVSRLRWLLEDTGAAIETRTPGYLLLAEPEAVDVCIQRKLRAEAASRVVAGRSEEAAELFRSATELWRGPSLSGVGAGALAAKAAQLEEERLSAIESYLDIELDLGRHARLIGEIGNLVEEHPFREKLRGQLMLSFYRSGRQAEALEAYRDGRDLLNNELGLDPGEELRTLEGAVLAGSPSLQVPPVPPVADARPEPADESPAPADLMARPFQLPADTSDFVGREEVIAGLRDALVESDSGGRVVVLMGRPGVGKSATAMRVAHSLSAEYYPDGQLYCDMRATRGTPISAPTALSRFLRALGVPAPAIPEDPDERAAMYRGLLAVRRVLVVLDDAALESQLLPLIPAGAGSSVVITSRSFLTGLPGAVSVQMESLSEGASTALLARVLGQGRVGAEPEAAQALVRAVGHLPLALRIVSARLAARPRWSLASMVERLADERHRLDELAHGDMTVRASLTLTYDGIDSLSARAFGLLGYVEGPTIPAWVAGALLDDRRTIPADLVEPLVDAHMIDIIGVDPAGEPIYRFHELVRDYAREQLEKEDRDTRSAAIARMLGGWLSLLDTANRVMMGGDYLRLRGKADRWAPPNRYVTRLLGDPYRWLEEERANIRHAVLQAVAEGMDEQAWELVVGYSLFLDRKGYVEDLSELFDTVEPLLRERGNRRGHAALVEAAGDAGLPSIRSEERIAAMREALADFVDLGDVHGQALARRGMADLVDHADVAQRIELCEQALPDFVAVGDLGGQRRCLMLMGYLRFLDGDQERGRAELGQGLSLAEQTGDPRALAQVLHLVGQVDRQMAEYGRAAEHMERAYQLVDRLDDPVGKAVVLRDFGLVNVEAGRITQARSLLTRSASLFEGFRDVERRKLVEQEIAKLDQRM